MQSKLLKTNGHDLCTFQTITDFVDNLQDFFGQEQNQYTKSLNMYHRLINNMSFKDEDLILRHIKCFKNFCLNNRTQITNRDLNLKNPKIMFSNKIYIDLSYIFQNADTDTQNVIWEYILSISALVDPENKAKELLQKLKHSDINHSENNFLFDMIENMNGTIQDTECTNPMEMFGSVINSGLMSNIVENISSNVENGNIDIGKLMNTAQTLMNTIKDEVSKSNDPLIQNMLSFIEPIETQSETIRETQSETQSETQLETQLETQSETQQETQQETQLETQQENQLKNTRE